MPRAKRTRSASGSAALPTPCRPSVAPPTTPPRRADDGPGRTITMAPNTDEKGAAELGREALAQFRDAARYGAKALAERKAARGATEGAGDLKGRAAGLKDRAVSLKERVPSKTDQSSRTQKGDESGSVKDRLPVPHAGGGTAGDLGELADAALARFGKKGKLASKMGVGHRLVNRLLP